MRRAGLKKKLFFVTLSPDNVRCKFSCFSFLIFVFSTASMTKMGLVRLSFLAGNRRRGRGGGGGRGRRSRNLRVSHNLEIVFL
jgi:hypothetical protein